jgi:hypothetical protein
MLSAQHTPHDLAGQCNDWRSRILLDDSTIVITPGERIAVCFALRSMKQL